jgi:hypothetical protein
VRLLTIHAAWDEGPLVSELSTISLNEKPRYEAFSYLWVAPTFTARLRLKGLDPDLMMTESLAEGLRKFRHAREERKLWIDQICIDQNDVDERSAQSQLMGELYENAVCVLLWLGRDTCNDVTLANSITQQISGLRDLLDTESDQLRLQEYVRSRRDYRTRTAGEPVSDILDMLAIETKKWEALERLIGLPYWGRV